MKPQAWVMVLAMLLVFGAIAPAEEKPAAPRAPARPVPGERAGVQMLERIRFSLGDLKLSDEQKTKVDEIFKQARRELDELRQEVQSMDPDGRMERVGEFFRKVRSDVGAVLNEEQRTILHEKLVGKDPVAGADGGAGAGAGEPMRPAEMLQRLRDNIPKLLLNEEQKKRLADLLRDVQAKGLALRQQAQTSGENVREQARQLLEETQQQVNRILTPAQQQKLRELMRDAGPATPSPTTAKAPATQAMMMGEGEDMMMRGSERKSSAKKPAAAAAQSGDPTKAPVGSAAPQFALKKLDGSLVQLSTLKGRVVVLVFGSWTCPAFRDRAAALEKMKSDYSTGVQFFIVYTREAHAKDEWEVARNKDLEIIVEQPKTMDARAELGKKARDELKLTTPIVLDSLANDTAGAYGAGVNSAFVISRDGKIVARQQWFDPAGLRRAIDEAVKATPSTRPAS